MRRNEDLRKLIELINELRDADGFGILVCIGKLELEYKKQIDDAYKRGYEDGYKDCYDNIVENIDVMNKIYGKLLHDGFLT